MAHYIDADKLKAEIGNRYDNMLNRAKLDSENANYWNGKADAYRAIYDHIYSLQQEALIERKERERQYNESSRIYWGFVLNRIDEKRILPSFKGKLLHDFKNELNTMKQIVGLINHSEIPEALFDKLALVFATWGGYHFHPKVDETEDSLQQEQQMPDSTQIIAEWEKEKAVLTQKDFRGDAERMAYNAFLDGFAKGLGYEGTK